MKKTLSIFLVITSFVFIFIPEVSSKTEYNVAEMDNCKEFFTENNQSGSFLYGYNINTLYSVMVLPSNTSRYVSVNGKIRSVCQDGYFTCALYERSSVNGNYTVVRMNMKNGECNYYDFNGINSLVNKYFAVSNGRIYFMMANSVYCYVTSYLFDGTKQTEYKFDDDVLKLFTNNSSVYAELYNGKIYRLNNKSSEYAVSVNSSYSFSNAGLDRIFSNIGSLISLQGKTTRFISNSKPNCVVSYGNSILYASGTVVYLQSNNNLKSYDIGNSIISVFCFDGNFAVLTSDYKLSVIKEAEFESNNTNNDHTNNNQSKGGNSDNTASYFVRNGIICGVESGTTVSKFKNVFSTSVSVYDSNGEKVTSGKMKSGYSSDCYGELYYISVTGDLTGEGNVKSNDVSALMSELVEKIDLNSVFRASADYNLDGAVDNKDLILISRKSKSS